MKVTGHRPLCMCTVCGERVFDVLGVPSFPSRARDPRGSFSTSDSLFFGLSTYVCSIGFFGPKRADYLSLE